MKFFLSVFFPLHVFAFTFEVIGPCAEQPIYKTESTLRNMNLGSVTENLLKKGNIPYTGDKSGIKSIANSAVGDDSLEVLSDTMMRAYGWCVEIDGFQPDVMPDQVMIRENTQQIRWFYAFTLYDSGNWKEFCTPSYLVKSKQFCPN